MGYITSKYLNSSFGTKKKRDLNFSLISSQNYQKLYTFGTNFVNKGFQKLICQKLPFKIIWVLYS